MRRGLLAFAVIVTPCLTAGLVGSGLLVAAVQGADGWALVCLAGLAVGLVLVVPCTVAAARVVDGRPVSSVGVGPLLVPPSPDGPPFVVACRSPQPVELSVVSEPVWPLLDWRQP